MKKLSSGFTHLLLVIIIAVAGIGALGYLVYKNGQIKFTTKNLLTQNSSTYTNSNYNFNLKYPNNWTYEEMGTTTYFLPPNISKENKNDNSVYLNVRHINTPSNPVVLKTEIVRKVTIKDEIVNVYKVKNLPSEKYFAEIKRGDFYFKFVAGSKLKSEYDNDFDQILTTFEFHPLSDLMPTATDVPVLVSKESAIQKVKNLPEVKKFMIEQSNGIVESDNIEPDKGKWNIHVYEYIIGEYDGHTSTFNWYYVDTQTGEINKLIN